MSMGYRLLKLKQLMTGWVQYYKLAQMKSLLIQIDEWTRRRLRAVRWKEWKNKGYKSFYDYYSEVKIYT